MTQNQITIEELHRECATLKNIVLELSQNAIALANTRNGKKQAMTIEELAHTFNMSERQIAELCRRKGSPAFKKGEGRTSAWMCFPDKFENFLQRKSEPWKG